MLDNQHQQQVGEGNENINELTQNSQQNKGFNNRDEDEDWKVGSIDSQEYNHLIESTRNDH